MKHIKKTILLETFKSRIPLLYNSYNNGTLVDFSAYDNLNKVYEYYPMGNYNMLPCNLKLTDDFVSNAKQKVAEEVRNLTLSLNQFGFRYLDTSFNYFFDINSIALHYNGFYSLTYETIKNMFYFFKQYDSILSNGIRNFSFVVSDCDRKCQTAFEYFNIYIKNMTDYDYYTQLDYQYFLYGGSYVKNYLYDHIFLTFSIPTEYKSEWHVDHLWYMDALKWKYWFEERNDLYKDVTNCLLTEDCCDCEKYFKLGGYKMYEKLNEYITNTKIMDFEVDATNTVFFNPLLVTNSIDDIGEYTIFSTDWEGGANYSSSKYNGGTIVNFENDVYENNLLNKKGYVFDDDCKEFRFDSTTWTDYFVKHHVDPFSAYTEYSYKANGDFVVKESHITPNDMYLETSCFVKKQIYFNGEYYDVADGAEYLEYTMFGKTNIYRVLKDSYNNKYVLYKGKKYKAIIKNGKTYFDLLAIPCVREGQEVQTKTGKIVQINKDIYVSTENYFIINNMYYFIIDKYIMLDNNRYNIINNKICTILCSNYSDDYGTEDINIFGEYVSELKNDKCYTINNNMFQYLNKYIVYEVNKITGSTDSKLEMFKDVNVFYDDIGTVQNGKFKITENTYFAQPLENTCLDLYYEVGNVSRLSLVYTSETQTTTNLFWGDILTNMEFYYEDANGVITTNVFSSTNYGNDNLKTIEALNREWIKNHEDLLDEETYKFFNSFSLTEFIPSDLIRICITDKLVCRFTYYLGAIIEKDTTNKLFKLWNNSNKKFTCGVKYTEEDYLKLETAKYNITEKLSYNIYYYNLAPKNEVNAVYSSKDGVVYTQNPKATFEVKINSNILANKDQYNITYSKYNNVIQSPVFREEYKFGISSLQKVEEDIYIDRGIMKPIDKDLRLIEITTMEDLTQYGNGQFKIINNS